MTDGNAISHSIMNSKNKDQVFAAKLNEIKPFAFDQKVAEVFDDMVSRSIPFYQEIIRIVLDMCQKYYKGNGIVYDLGCSTGNTMLALAKDFKRQDRKIELVGVDSSEEMIEKAKVKLKDFSHISFFPTPIEEVEFKNAEVVILNYTLQFLPVEERLDLLKRIYKALKPGGILIISEKVKSIDLKIESAMTDLYYDFKRRNGYSELEISQKREALENVLVPLTVEEQVQMLKEAHFQSSDLLFKWYNFASYLGIKE